MPEKPALIVNIAIKIIPRMPETGQVGKCSRKTCWGQCYISSLCHQYPFGLVSCVFDLLDVVGSPTSSSDDVVFLFYNIFYFVRSEYIEVSISIVITMLVLPPPVPMKAAGKASTPLPAISPDKKMAAVMIPSPPWEFTTEKLYSEIRPSQNAPTLVA